MATKLGMTGETLRKWVRRKRDGFRVARCTVGRLMRNMGLRGAVRGRAWITTTHAGEGARPRDLVDRQFVPTRPNQIWVADFTYVATWGGFVFVSGPLDRWTVDRSL